MSPKFVSTKYELFYTYIPGKTIRLLIDLLIVICLAKDVNVIND